jgi:hypothetical protein
MLSKEENDFIRFWEANRLRRKKTVRQFLLGIPAGLLIVIPIVINFVSGWYKRANMEANSQDFNPGVLLVALLLIVGFTAIFWQRHQWDQYEQRYRELLARRDRDAAAAGTPEAGDRPIAAAGTPEAGDRPIAAAGMPETAEAGDRAASVAGTPDIGDRPIAVEGPTTGESGVKGD